MKLLFSGMGPHIWAIATFLGTIILRDEVYIPEVWKYIYNWCFHCGFLWFGHITSAYINSQLYKPCETQQQECNLICVATRTCLSWHIQNCIFFSFYHRNKPREKHPQLERKCMSVAVEGDSFLEATAFQHWAAIPVFVSGSSFSLNKKKVNCFHNTRMGFFVQALFPVSPSRQPSSLLSLQAEALHTLIYKMPGHSW